jgi:hypothetical protein
VFLTANSRSLCLSVDPRQFSAAVVVCSMIDCPFRACLPYSVSRDSISIPGGGCVGRAVTLTVLGVDIDSTASADHGGVIMVSTDILGSVVSANQVSVYHDVSEVALNLPVNGSPVHYCDSGLGRCTLSLAPLRWRCLTVTSRSEELIYFCVGPGYPLSVLWASRFFLPSPDICRRWLCLDQCHLLLFGQVLHLYRQQGKLGHRHEALLRLPLQNVLLPQSVGVPPNVVTP